VSEPSYRQKVKEIAEIAGEICTEWEIAFLDDMQTWTGDPTEKQQAVIDRLYEKACASGL